MILHAIGTLATAWAGLSPPRCCPCHHRHRHRPALANFLDDYKAERWAREADYRQASDPEAEQFIAERLWRARAALVHATRHGGSAWAAAARAPERRGRLRRSAREGNWRTERRL